MITNLLKVYNFYKSSFFVEYRTTWWLYEIHI